MDIYGYISDLLIVSISLIFFIIGKMLCSLFPKEYYLIASMVFHAVIGNLCCVVVRGEKSRCEFEVLIKKWRAAVLIQKHVKHRIARAMFDDQQKDVILLQSGSIAAACKEILWVLYDCNECSSFSFSFFCSYSWVVGKEPFCCY